MKPLGKLDMRLIDPVTDWRMRFFKKLRIQISKGQKVLDMGCGGGGDTLIFANMGANVVGIDINSYSNSQILKKENLKFIIADGCRLPFDDNTFDLVFEKDMLHHIDNSKKALSETKRVTKKGGQVIIIEANRYNPILYLHMTLIKRHEHLTRRYFKNLMKTYFKNTQFKMIEAHVYPIKLFCIMKLIHFIEDFLEKVPMISNFLSYNIAIAKKDGC